MIISNRNKHDRSDIRATRRDNVGTRPLDVEIKKSIIQISRDVINGKRRPTKAMKKTPALLLLLRQGLWPLHALLLSTTATTTNVTTT
jgi:hypothetical protein